MKTWELLYEAREDYIASQLGDKLTIAYKSDSTDNKPSFSNVAELVYFLSKHTNPKYIQWVAKQYATRNFKLEDLSRIKQELMDFDRVKSKLEIKDLNQFKTSGDLFKALQPFQQQEVKSGKQQARDKSASLFASGDAEYLYKGKTLDVVIPHTKEASCELGKGTRWCTAATKSKNAFDHYNKAGPLYIIRTRDGQKFQFHFGTDGEPESLMDEVDEEVDAHDLVQEYPELKDAFNDLVERRGAGPVSFAFLKKPSKESIMRLVDMTYGTALQYQLDPALQDEEIALAAVKHYAISFAHVRPDLQTKEMALIAVSENPHLLAYVRPDLQNYIRGKMGLPQK